MDLWGRLPTRSERSEASKIDNFRPKLVPDWSKFKTGVRIACSRHLVELGAAEAVSASDRALRPSSRAWAGPTRASYPWATSGALWLRISHFSTRTGAFERRLPPPAVLRAPLGRPHRCAARSRSSVILIHHVVTRATATCAAERPESFAAPRKRSGTLPRTSLSGARSTKTLDMRATSAAPRAPPTARRRARARAAAEAGVAPPRARRPTSGRTARAAALRQPSDHTRPRPPNFGHASVLCPGRPV